MSDMPWAMAWYGQSQSVWLTSSPEDFLAISDYQKPIKLLLLTRMTIDTRLWTQWLVGAQEAWKLL